GSARASHSVVADSPGCYRSPRPPETRRRGRHGRTGAIALAIWHSGRCEASAYERPGMSRISERLTCATTGEAKTRADRLMSVAYPHDCEADGCAPWIPFVRP